MGTINSRDIIDQIIADNGWDPPIWAVKIVEYRNFSGRQCWGVVYSQDDWLKYERPSEYITNPVVIWERPMPSREELQRKPTLEEF